MIARQLRDDGRMSAFSSASPRRLAYWLVILSLLMFTPGFFGLPPIDRDEARFAQASKQMIETGDYVSIHFLDEARNKKPAAIYWMQALAVQAAEFLGVPGARTTIWVYRIPSLIGALGVVLATFWAGLSILSPIGAALAATMMTSTILLNVEARLATTDAVLCATVAVAMGAMLRLRVSRESTWRSDWGLPLAFWTAIGVGVLVKGPITPLIPALAALALAVYEKSGRWLLRLKPGRGLLLALAIAAPWLLAITLKTHGAFLSDSVGGDMLAKVGSAQESHGAPPGSYFLAFWLTAWPMAPFAALAAPFVWRERRSQPFAFLLAWLLPTWLLFELVPTKLPHYVLPLYPAIALIVALAAERGALDMSASWRKWVVGLIPGVPALVLAGIIFLAVRQNMTPGVAALAAAPAIVWRSVAFIRAPKNEGPNPRLLDSALLAWLVMFAALSGVAASSLGGGLLLSSRLAAARDASLSASGCAGLDAMTTSYREPSLVFLLGSGLHMGDPASAAAFLASGTCRIVFVEQAEEKDFSKDLPNSAGAPAFKRIAGLNLGRGRWETIDVWTRGP